jgi:UDP-glucose 4-epimerase
VAGIPIAFQPNAGERLTAEPNNWRGRRVLITGGLGFIGSNLAHRLIDFGANLFLLDSLIPGHGGQPLNIEGIRDRVRLSSDDLRDTKILWKVVEGQDVIFNLAGQTSHMASMSDPVSDLEINAAAQLHLLEACRCAAPHSQIIFASTRQVYGKPDYLPVDEQHQPRPIDVNGINKLAGEQYHLLYHRVHGLKACILRLTNTYGPRMRIKDSGQTFLGVWIRSILQRKAFEVWGGDQLRDFTYVDDTVDALLAAASVPAAQGKAFNIGGFPPTSLSTLAKLLTDIDPGGGYMVKPFPEDRKAIDIGDYYADDSAFRAISGWEPRVDLREGLERTLAYFRSRLEQYC